MGTNFAPLVVYVFLFWYEKDFMMSHSDDKHADFFFEAFNTTSRYLYDILNINNIYFDNMVRKIYPAELQLNKANTFDNEAAFLEVHLFISNDIISTKMYDKHIDFDFEIVNFPFLYDVVPRSTSYGVYISKLIREHLAMLLTSIFAIKCSLRNLSNKTTSIIKFAKHNFYRIYYDLISKFNIGFKSLLCLGLNQKCMVT